MKNTIFRTAFLLLPLVMQVSCGPRTVRIEYDASVKDYTPVVREILEDNPDGNVVLHFPRGNMSSSPSPPCTEYLSMSNNDSGDRKVAFLIKDMKNVSVKCDGAEFLFHGAMVPFAVKDSENVSSAVFR